MCTPNLNTKPKHCLPLNCDALNTQAKELANLESLAMRAHEQAVLLFFSSLSLSSLELSDTKVYDP